MKINPYLHFAGNCEEAFKFYEKAIGGKIEGFLPFGDDEGPAWKGKVMHGSMQLGDIVLMGTDAPPKFYQKPQGFRVTINVDTNEEAERIYAALSAGGNITVPLDETFFAHRFAMLEDKFGQPWIIHGAPKSMGGNK